MTGPLDEVTRRLDASGLDPDVRALVAAACPGSADEPATRSDADRSGAAHLRSITVEGFRGIGPKTTLSFPAGPGLTLVVGRNGSGKSSFAEALELLLTGDSRRWYKRTSIWKEGWQNLHHHGDTTTRAEFDVAGCAGPLSVWRSWAPGVALGAAAPAAAQVKGQPQGRYAELGWDQELSTFRPSCPTTSWGRSSTRARRSCSTPSPPCWASMTWWRWPTAWPSLGGPPIRRPRT